MPKSNPDIKDEDRTRGGSDHANVKMLDIRRRVTVLFPDEETRPEPIHLVSGQVLVDEGEDASNRTAYLVLHGTLHETKSRFTGKQRVRETLCEWTPGRVARVHALLPSQARHLLFNQLEAATDAIVLPITKDDIQDVTVLWMLLENAAYHVHRLVRDRTEIGMATDLLAVLQELGARKNPNIPLTVKQVIAGIGETIVERDTLLGCVADLQARNAGLSDQNSQLIIANAALREATENGLRALESARVEAHKAAVELRTLAENLRKTDYPQSAEVAGLLGGTADILDHSDVELEAAWARVQKTRRTLFPEAGAVPPAPGPNSQAASSRVVMPSLRDAPVIHDDAEDSGRETLTEGFALNEVATLKREEEDGPPSSDPSNT